MTTDCYKVPIDFNENMKLIVLIDGSFKGLFSNSTIFVQENIFKRQTWIVRFADSTLQLSVIVPYTAAKHQHDFLTELMYRCYCYSSLFSLKSLFSLTLYYVVVVVSCWHLYVIVLLFKCLAIITMFKTSLVGFLISISFILSTVLTVNVIIL